MHRLILLLAVLVFSPSVAAQNFSFPYVGAESVREEAAPPAPVRADMRTRDGVLLAADVWLPPGVGPWPVILLRTPYLRASAADAFDVGYWTSRGYAFVAQDVRGKGDSEGVFEPWEHEAADGYDAIEWAGAQHWSNGRVGTLGGSYLGAVQWAAASQRPPSLRAMVVLPAISDPFYGGAYDSGVFSLAPYWPYENALQRPRAVPAYDEARVASLPLEHVDEAVLGADVPQWNSYVARPVRTQWRAARWPADVCRQQAPVLMFIALWDGDGAGPVLNWEALNRCSRVQRSLVFGPWPHSMSQRGRRGDQIYGEGAQVSILRIAEEWFETHLRGDRGDTPTARVFVTGENRWRTFEHWPPRSRSVRYFLSMREGLPGLSTQRARERASLALRQGADIGVGRTLAEATFAATTLMPAAPADEQIVFITEPFDTQTLLGGSPRLHLALSAAADDADIFAFIVAISPNGEMRALTHPGKLRLSYSRGVDRRDALRIGRETTFEVRLWDFAHSFAPGERLGLVLRAEWFPRWARNTGAGPLAGATVVPSVTHQIVVGGATNARLTLSRLD